MHILTSFTDYFAFFHQGRFVFVSKNLFLVDTALIVSQSLYCFTISICHGVETMSPGCAVRASLMLFLNYVVRVNVMI